MTISPAVLDAMLAAGCTADQIVAAVKADAAEMEAQGPRAVPSWLRAEVFNRDNWTCVYCGSKAAPLHCDHVRPYSRGGATSSENLVTACQSCNTSKRDRTPEEWISR